MSESFQILNAEYIAFTHLSAPNASVNRESCSPYNLFDSSSLISPEKSCILIYPSLTHPEIISLIALTVDDHSVPVTNWYIPNGGNDIPEPIRRDFSNLSSLSGSAAYAVAVAITQGVI